MSSQAAEALRAIQKPLKDQYRSHPDSALVVLTSRGTLDPTTISCSLGNAAAAKRVAGLHQAAGGAGHDVSALLCSGDMLLESLVACLGVTVRAVSTSMGIPLASGTITAEGDLDFRGTMGVKDADGSNVAVGFQSIRLTLFLTVDDEHRAKLDKLVSLSERFCVVLQTLRNGVSINTQLGKAEDAETSGDSKAVESNVPVLNDEEVLPLQ